MSREPTWSPVAAKLPLLADRLTLCKEVVRMAMATVSRVTSKGQVTIPRAVREELQLETGDQVEWQVNPDGRVALRKLEGQLRELVGLLGRPDRRVSVAEMDQGIRRHLRRKHARR
jgi:AbrB family looped-hinge helix DNA binding protein